MLPEVHGMKHVVVPVSPGFGSHVPVSICRSLGQWLTSWAGWQATQYLPLSWSFSAKWKTLFHCFTKSDLRRIYLCLSWVYWIWRGHLTFSDIYFNRMSKIALEKDCTYGISQRSQDTPPQIVLCPMTAMVLIARQFVELNQSVIFVSHQCLNIYLVPVMNRSLF